MKTAAARAQAVRGRPLERIRRSLTAQIGLAIAGIAIVLATASAGVATWLAERNLRENGEITMLGYLLVLREAWAAEGGTVAEADALVRRFDPLDGRMHLALVDANRQWVAKSAAFELPLAAVPSQALDARLVPRGSASRAEALLDQAADRFTSVWRAPDGRRLRVLFARLPPPGMQGPLAAQPLYVVLTYESAQDRRLLTDELGILGLMLLVSTVVAGAAGTWIAQRIVAAPRRLATQASRMSEGRLTARLSLEHTPTELIESTLAFNHMLDRLQDSIDRLSRFSSDIAHDLRTPINNLLGEAQVALAKPRSAAEYRAVLESAVEDYERLSRFIQNLLFIARAENPQTALQRDWIEMGPLLERTRSYFESVAEEAGAALEVELPRGPQAAPRVWADESLLLRVLGNLVTNALRHAVHGSAVVVGCRSAADASCTIEVSNEGEPIPPEYQQRIFDRAFRVDPSRAGSTGASGLGLAIVKSVMDLHGGSVAVASGPGRRTVFSVHFPGPPAG